MSEEKQCMTENWVIKLCDFGWSTHSINENRTTFCGTPDYLAPELVVKAPYDDKLYTWEVGILTYELLTGASHFAGRSRKAIAWGGGEDRQKAPNRSMERGGR